MTATADRATEEVGFIGLGIMGQPMALNRCCHPKGRSEAEEPAKPV